MAKTKDTTKNTHNFYLNLLKTALKDKDFLDNKEIFEDLLIKSGIDINIEFERDQNINFLSLTLNNFDKFKYLVEKHHANPHVFSNTDKYMERFTIATDLLDKMPIDTPSTKLKEDKKIFNYLKKDKYTWLDKKVTTYSSKSDEIEETFFEIYFNKFPNKQSDLEQVLKLNFSEQDKEEAFIKAKNALAFELCFSVLHENIKNGYIRHGENKLNHVKNYLPILEKNNLVNFNEDQIEKLINLSSSAHYRIGFAKTEALELFSLLIDNKALTVEKLNQNNFTEKFVNQFIVYIEEEIKTNQKHNNNLKTYDKEHERILTDYSFPAFEELIKNLETLNSMGVSSYVLASQKQKLVEIIDVILSDPNRSRKKHYNINSNEKFDLENEQKNFAIIKELILVQNEEALQNNTVKKVKI
jgi:hypothetical protein